METDGRVSKPIDLPPSPALSLLAKAPQTLKGRKAGILITDGFPAELFGALQSGFKKAGCAVAVIAPKIGGAAGDDGVAVEADFAISGGPSFLFDTVVLLVSGEGCEPLLKEAAAVNWVRDAFGHLKVIGFVPAAQPLLDAASVVPDDGIVAIGSRKQAGTYIETAAKGRRWEREPSLRSIA